MQPTDDGVLLRQYSENHSEEAFAALVTRHINLVYSVAVRCVGDPHQAEEVTQAVFITLAKRAAQLRHDKALSSWLFQTTRLTVSNFVRSETRRHRRELEAQMQSVLNDPGNDLWPSIAPMLDEAVAGLNEKDRHAIVLRFYEGRNLREVGAALGASEDAAEKRVHRAVEKIRTFFAKRGVTVGASGLLVALSANAVQAAPVGMAQSVTVATMATGAMVATSTSSLIPGVLKLMASTKLKSTAFAIAAILLVTGTLVVILNAVYGRRTTSPPDIQGSWEGVTAIPGVAALQQGEEAKTRVLFRFFKTNGAYTAIGELLDTSPHHYQAAEFLYDHPLVRFKSGLNESFQGTLNASATEISGSVRLGEFSQPLLLKRTSTPAAVPLRMSESDHAPRTGSDLQGTWRGTLGNGARAVRVIVKIAEPSSGNYRAELDNETGDWFGQPMSVTYNQPELSLRVNSGAGMFQGTLNGDHTEMVGSWLQGGRREPARFWRED
jgi:RNA polymerase sigma factor (sigma-70 family)